ncbi:MAG: hypothetical protein WD491_12125 [Balneolales bacterium]
MHILKILLIIVLLFTWPNKFGNIDQQLLRELGPADRIQIYSDNNWYWQYKQQPVLLIGASNEDNLWNRPGDSVEAELDDLISIKQGESSPIMFYVRNTMSSRDFGNVWWFRKDDNGLYDLNTFEQEYWARFENFLKMTSRRNIIVQIEVFDRFDFARGTWANENPFNPANNNTYTASESGLEARYSQHPGENENLFFYSVPDLENNHVILPYQHAIVDKLMEVSLPYGNVLYCISNETNGAPEWGEYWASRIRQKAAEAGKEVEVTEMWDSREVYNDQHLSTINLHDLYTYVDISQNNHKNAQEHWDNMIASRNIISVKPRPMNNVKIYGADEGEYHGKSAEEATRRLWRNTFAGMASSRFHRPPHGIGLSTLAKTHLRSMHLFTTEFDVFNAIGHNYYINNRSSDEAYGMTNRYNQYAVYFPDDGSVNLDIQEGNYSVHWLNILESRWQNSTDVTTDGSEITLSTPAEGQWVVLVKREPD